jgi:hypothetical protein
LLVLDIASELVLLNVAIHEPVAVQAQQVEPVEALEQAHQVGSVSEVRLLIFTELIETNVASAFN